MMLSVYHGEEISQVRMPVSSRVLVSYSNLNLALMDLRSKLGPLFLDIESSGLDDMADDARLAGIVTFCPESLTTYYFPFDHVLSDCLEVDVVHDIYQAIAHRDHVWHNAYFDLRWLRRLFGWKSLCAVDTYVVLKVLNFAQTASLKGYATSLGISNQLFSDLVDYDSGETICDVRAEEAAAYAWNDPEATWLIYVNEYLPRKDDQIIALEMACQPATLEMMFHGMATDADFLHRVEDIYNLDLARAEKEAHAAIQERLPNCTHDSRCPYGCTGKWSYCTMKVNSNRRLSSLLYEVLDLPTKGIRQTKTGYTVNHHSLETQVINGETWLTAILDFNTALKARGMAGTYLEAIRNDDRIHCELLQNWVVSGRFASRGPNMQQVPKRKPLPNSDLKFRSAFVASPGYYLFAADYAQIELRVFAALAGARVLLDSFRKGIDAHAVNASLSYNVPVDQVTDSQRDTAKTVGFGLLYGQTSAGLARTLRIPVHQADRILNSFFETLPEYESFVEDSVRRAHQASGAHTLFGRWIPIEGLNDRRWGVRKKAERLAVNARIQGTAADVLKLAMSRIYRNLRASDFYKDVRLLLTVHDEIIMEVPEHIEYQHMAEKVLGWMEFPLGAPEDPTYVNLIGDASWGYDWGSLRSLDPETYEEVIYTPPAYDYLFKAEGPAALMEAIFQLFLKNPADDGLIVRIVQNDVEVDCPVKVNPQVFDTMIPILDPQGDYLIGGG